MILYVYKKMGQGQTVPRDKFLMTTEMSGHFSNLLQVLKNLLKVRFYTIFYDLIHAYSSRAGLDSPQGTKF